MTLSKNIFSFCGAFRHAPGPGGGEIFLYLSKTDLESLSSAYDVYVVLFLSVVKRSICYSSLVLQRKKRVPDLKFREEICLSVCVSVEARSL